MLCRKTALDEFSGVAGDSTRPLQYYCNILPMLYLTDQRRLLFWKKTHYSDNVVLKTLSVVKNNNFVVVGSKYAIS